MHRNGCETLSVNSIVLCARPAGRHRKIQVFECSVHCPKHNLVECAEECFESIRGTAGEEYNKMTCEIGDHYIKQECTTLNPNRILELLKALEDPNDPLYNDAINKAVHMFFG